VKHLKFVLLENNLSLTVKKSSVFTFNLFSSIFYFLRLYHWLKTEDFLYSVCSEIRPYYIIYINKQKLIQTQILLVSCLFFYTKEAEIFSRKMTNSEPIIAIDEKTSKLILDHSSIEGIFGNDEVKDMPIFLISIIGKKIDFVIYIFKTLMSLP